MAAPGKRSFFTAVVLASAVAAACGSSNSNPPGASGDGGSLGASSGSSGGSSGSFGGGGDDSGAIGTFGSDASLSPDAFAGCASSTQEAKELPLDLYLMLDSSGSMDDLVAPQKSKWNSVAAAMTAFFNDPASAGIGVGLQYFPLTQAGVPTSCTASSQCGMAGPCFFNACAVNTAVYPCDTSANCPGNAACMPIGYCDYDHDTICSPIGADCLKDSNNFPLGMCKAFTTSTCIQGDSCTVQDYKTPAVPIALLPGAASALTASLAAHSPNGNTPTAAALEGAIEQAKSYALANPGHTVVAVLATDGIPDECIPNDIPTIAQIAAAGLAGTPSIKTFTIGVFTPSDATSGAAAVNQIASAGGTKQAFVINTMGQDVEAQFQAALTSIRGAALPCQYEVPLPEAGNADYGKINVQYTSGAGMAMGFPYVESAARCGTGGGWYYDVDPAEGGTPRAVIVCPSTCTTLESDSKGRVDVVIGCQTVTR